MNCEKDEKIEHLVDTIAELEDRNGFYDDKVKTLETKIDILDKRRLGSDFCEYCDKEFKSGCEKDRKKKKKSYTKCSYI